MLSEEVAAVWDLRVEAITVGLSGRRVRTLLPSLMRKKCGKLLVWLPDPGATCNRSHTSNMWLRKANLRARTLALNPCDAL